MKEREGRTDGLKRGGVERREKLIKRKKKRRMERDREV